MKRCLLAILLAASILIGVAAPATAATGEPKEITITLDGEVRTYADKPVLMNNRLLVPLRAIFEDLGAIVEWHEENPDYIFAHTQDYARQVTLQIGFKTAYVTVKNFKSGQDDEQELTLDQEAVKLGGRAYVPLRFVSEALGATVKWDPVKRIASVTSYTSQTVNLYEEALTQSTILDESRTVSESGTIVFTKMRTAAGKDKFFVQQVQERTVAGKDVKAYFVYSGEYDQPGTVLYYGSVYLLDPRTNISVTDSTLSPIGSLSLPSLDSLDQPPILLNDVWDETAFEVVDHPVQPIRYVLP